MRIHANGDAAKKLGEFLLDTLARGAEMQVVYLALHELRTVGYHHPSAGKLEQVLTSGTRLPRSTAFSMPDGDLFVIAGRFTAESLRQLTSLLAANLEGVSDHDTISALCQIFEIPDDAIPLRKLIRAHLNDEVPRSPGSGTAGEAGESPPPGGTSPGDRSAGPMAIPRPTARKAARGPTPVVLEGPLTLELLQHLKRLLDQIDMAPFIRQQAVYSRAPAWQLRYVEHFFDITRLRETYFPRIDLHANESLFVQFTRSLDDLMLVQILGRRAARHGRIGLNLSISTVPSPTFEQVTRHLAAEERQNVVCELHWIEFLQDIQDGGGAVRRLLEFGYRLALDRIGAAVLPYLDLRDSPLDFIKVPFDRAAMVRIDPGIISALKRCDPGKLVLTTCDDRKAVALGEALGIRNFQGRLIDQLVDRAA